MADQGLLIRLEGIRRTIRRRLLGFGISAVLAGGVASFLTVVTLDWMLWFPAALRLFVAVLFFAGFFLAAAHWIFTPLRTELTIAQIARRLERHFPSLRDRLSSTVQILERGEGESSPLAAQVAVQTQALVESTRLENALTPKPLMMSALTLSGAACALLLLVGLAPDWVRTGVRRYVAPLGATEWPRTVEIEPLTGDMTVAIGESATVRMLVRRGLSDTLRGMLRMRDASGDLLPLVMQQGEEGKFQANIDAITRDLIYWFEAGDDTTEPAPFRIRAVHRPELIECLATVEPPAYAHDQSTQVHDLKEGPVRAALGGFVTLDIRASKPLWNREPARVGLRRGDGSWEPLTVSTADARHATIRLEVVADMEFRVEVADEEGFENRGGAAFSLLAVADRAPNPVIVDPQTLVELTPKATLDIRGRVDDDHGVASAELLTERADGSVKSSLVNLGPLESGAGGVVVAGADATWNAADHTLVPGETVYLILSAVDNCPPPYCTGTDGAAGQRGRSSPLPVKIIGEVELETRTRDEVAALEARLRQIILDQTSIRDATASLAAVEQEQGLSVAQRDAATALAGSEARLARSLREVAGRFAALRQRLERNQSGEEDARRQLAELENVLNEVASGPMTSAASTLGQAAETQAAADQRALLQDAERDESVAVDRLRGVMQIVGRWGDFQGVLARTRDLLDRQVELRTETLETGKETLGKGVGELSAEEAAELKSVQRRQEQLTEDAEQMLAQMERLAQRIKDKDASGAEALDAAQRSARAQDLLKRMRASSSGIGENRTAAVAIDQQAAAETLKRMVAALRKREDRELELLRKNVQKAGEQVAELLAQQTALRGETADADRDGVDDDAAEALTERQRTLRRNTRHVADEIAEEQKMGEAAGLVRQATVPMGEAEVVMEDREFDEALPAQDEAVNMLMDAAQQLAALDEAVAQQELQRSLAEIHDHLAQLLAMQKGVNEGLAALRESVVKAGRVDRSAAREAARLARDQSAAQQALEEVRPELQKVPVFDWALNRVAGWMQSCRDWLEQRKVDEDLESTAQRITRELEQLLAAVRETQQMPLDQEFAEAESGGGGAGEAGESKGTKPIPTMAELLVLRAMQMDIQTRTRSLHESTGGAPTEENQLRELRMLGEDQAQVRSLAEKLMAKAQGG